MPRLLDPYLRGGGGVINTAYPSLWPVTLHDCPAVGRSMLGAHRMKMPLQGMENTRKAVDCTMFYMHFGPPEHPVSSPEWLDTEEGT